MSDFKANVEIYYKPTCPYSQKALALLDTKGVKYKAIDVSENQELHEEMVDRTKGGSTVPQIFINNRHIGGCDDIVMLESAGKLDNLLLEDNKS